MRPFCGKAGWVLNGFLASAGISRSQVWVGNVAQVRPSPTSNDFHLFDWNGGAVQEGIAALREDLAHFRPNIVVALGNAALHLLRQGNVAPPKSKQLQLFQWSSHVSTWRGSLFRAAASFDRVEASEVRFGEGRCPALPLATLSERPSAPTPPAAQCGPSTSQAPAGAGNGELLIPAHRSISGDGDPTVSVALAPTPLAVSRSLSVCTPAETDTRAAQNMDRIREIAGSPVRKEPATFKAIATYHPAATFREPSFAFPLVSDLKRAVAEARSPLLELPPRRIVWGLAIDDLEARCAAIRAARTPVGFDIEGGLGGLQCASFATTPHDAFVIDLMGAQFDRPRTMAALASVLEDPLVPKVLWNAAYERAILHAVASITLRGYEDGMLAWWERFSELPKGLDFVASILTREPYWAEGIGWDRKTGAPRVTGPPFWTYNAIDSCVTLEIWQHPLIRAVAESRTPVAFTL